MARADEATAARNKTCATASPGRRLGGATSLPAAFSSPPPPLFPAGRPERFRAQNVPGSGKARRATPGRQRPPRPPGAAPRPAPAASSPPRLGGGLGPARSGALRAVRSGPSPGDGSDLRGPVSSRCPRRPSCPPGSGRAGERLAGSSALDSDLSR